MMAFLNDKTLRIQGRMAPGLLPKFLRSSPVEDEKNNEAWFFVDYSPADFPLKSTFNLSFSSSGKLLDASSVVSIEAVYDSFGHVLDEGIPKGYKTVVRFAFSKGLSNALTALPALQGWKPTENEVLLANTGDVKFNDFPELLNDLARFLVFGFQGHRASHSGKMGKEEFVRLIEKSGLKDSDNLLRFLTFGGYIKQNEDEVELVSRK